MENSKGIFKENQISIPKSTSISSEITRNRYQRISRFYDAMEIFAEKRFRAWREQLWSQVNGSTILEVGVGTGKNISYYPKAARVTGIDLTPGMLEQAKRKVQALEIRSNVDLRLGDVQMLDFPNNSFDSALATFVFCSVPDPVLGLREMRRVVRPGGSILLLEHMRSPNPQIGKIMDWLNPLVVRMMGANINRPTVENVWEAGLEIARVEDLGMGGVFKMIVARVNKTGNAIET